MIERPYRLLGGPGSPYSLKMRAVLRYRRLPHTWTVPTGFPGQAPDLLAADKKMIPVLQLPEGGYWADTTPMILALEQRHPGQRSVLPDDPAQRFLARLIEDFADEWLVLPMFDYRWNLAIDQMFCARRQMAGWLGAMPKAQFDDLIERFTQRQTMLLASLGDREGNRPLLQATYRDVLAAVEAQLETSRFLFGSRPSIAEFGLFGQLSQCAVDPSASQVMRVEAVRAFQWAQDLDDASGIEGEWYDAMAPLGAGVRALLTLIGEVYLPYLEANTATASVAEKDAALASSAQLRSDYSPGRPDGAKRVSVKLRGLPYEAPVMSYKLRCLAWLKQALDEVTGEPRVRLEAILRAHGCWERLQFGPGERECVPLLKPL